MATFYLDPDGGNDSNDGTTFANRWKTWQSGPTAARIAPGDTIRVIASPSPTSLGQTATWTNGGDTITLSSAVTLEVSDCDSAWTAATNVTQTTQTADRREGTGCQRFAIAAGFTTGKAAHFALAGSTDFSGYQQISFWIKTSSAITASNLSIRLCSDTTGDTPVDTFTIPYAIPTGSRWIPVTIDKGSALGSSIQSVSIAFASDPGTPQVTLDNIIACKASSSADSLNLMSLVSKNTAGEPWFAIRSIDGTTVALGWGSTGGGNETDTQGRVRYWGSSESVTTYKREMINYMKQTVTGISINDSGTPDNPITFSGGWNRTNMSTQDSGDESWIFNDDNILLFSQNWLVVEKISGATSTGTVFSVTGGFSTFSRMSMAATGTIGFEAGTNNILDLDYIVGCVTGLFVGAATLDGNIRAKVDKIWCTTGGMGISIANSGILLPFDVEVTNQVRGGATGLGYGSTTSTGRIRVRNTTFNDNTTDIAFGISQCGLVELDNCVYDAWSETLSAPLIRSTKDQGVAGAVYIHQYGQGTIRTATDQRHTASDVSWKLKPQSTTLTSSMKPIVLAVARVAVFANLLCTAKLWAYRDNSNLSGRFMLKANQIAGVTTDVSDSISVNNTWEELTITFTPTEDGVVEFTAEAWNNVSTTASFWVDDFSFTQAS